MTVSAMLRSISLKNLATISDTSMEFSRGLNVITGETGSGKSILVDGLMLATGKRADRTLVRPGTRTASVEAVFLDRSGEERVVRREINVQGRSRVFLDDSLSSLEEIRETLDDLVELHSQRSTPALLKRSRQLDLLDGFAGSEGIRRDYSACYERYEALLARERELRKFLEETHGSREILLHEQSLFQELRPTAEDFEALSAAERELTRAAELAGLFSSCAEELQGEDGLGSRVSALLADLTRKAPEKTEIIELLQQAEISLQEAAAMIIDQIPGEDGGSGSLQTISSRLDGYHSLISRFGGSLEAMLKACDSVERRLEEYETAGRELEGLTADTASTARELTGLAAELTSARKDAASELARGVEKGIRELNMPHAVFKVELIRPARTVTVEDLDLSPLGAETVRFLFSANAGMPPEPLDAVASGGELSRVALALALTAAGRVKASTLVFDEIDSGTGGETAHKLADCLVAAALSRQVIVISHLAQVAARAGRHLAVEKNVSEGMPVTVVNHLERSDARERELARLLGGGSAAAAHASRLLGASCD